MTEREQIIDDLTEIAELLGNQETLDSKISKAKEELEIVETMVQMLIDKRTKTNELSEEEFLKQYEALEERNNKLTARINALITEKTIQRGKKEKILASVELMQKEPGTILKWSKEAWMAMVESAIIHKDKTVSFKFYCGRTINV